MSTELEKNGAIHKEMIRLEMIEGLGHALNRSYRRLLETARADWERLFSGKDPSDACVSVHVTEPQTQSARGSGFLKARKPSRARESAKRDLPRFAH